tara:strand:- start:1677 stop:2318 length:642 start_codon:yes stop_codon:yes gene_type:complete
MSENTKTQDENQYKVSPAWELLCTFSLFAFYGFFVMAFSYKVYNDQSISALLYLIYELMFLFMVVIRNLPKRVSASYYDWVIAIVGTVLPVLMRPTDIPNEHMLLLGMQFAGCVITFIGLMTLSRSFGLVPANRGVRTSGLYQYIRHPLYSGYFLSIGSFMLQNFSLWNLAIFLGFAAFEIARIFAEEKLLMQDPKYQAYAEKTKWRLYPYVW